MLKVSARGRVVGTRGPELVSGREIISVQKKYTLLSIAAVFAGIIGYVAYRTRRVPTPKNNWKRFDAKGNTPINASIQQQLQGIYFIEEGKDFFGENAVAKWSYAGDEDKIIHQLSFFCEKEGRYIICEGKQEGNKILLQGHWRKARRARRRGLIR